MIPPTPQASPPRRLTLREALAPLLAGVILVAAAGSAPPRPDPADGFARAETPRSFEFPRDHGSHPEYKTEWWYLTGVLETPNGERVGYQATWFRSALKATPEPRESKLATRDLFFFHGAVTDVARGSFHFDQAACRGASTWAGAETGRLNVFLLGRNLEADEDGSWRLRFAVDGRRIELYLRPRRPPLLHGEPPGLSQKAPEPGQASYYASHTRMQTVGTIERDAGGLAVRVEGTTWFDHEFGSSQLSDDQVGWDWFSVPLDDGTDLMLYAIRKRDGSIEPLSSGTLRFADGRRLHLARKDFSIEILARWKSSASGGEYPSRWRLRVPAHRIDLHADPALADQELRTRGTTGVTYWEGLSRFRGTVGGRPVSAYGYIELVGYAGEFVQGI